MYRRASPVVTIIIAIMFFLSVPMVVWGAEIEVPSDIKGYAEELGAAYGICPELIESMIFEESGFHPDATSKNGKCKGLMQVNPACHKDRMDRLGVTDIYDTYGNMLVGTDFLSELFETYEDVGTVLLRYNGVSNAKVQNYEQTGKLSGYATRIINRSEEWERLHNK